MNFAHIVVKASDFQPVANDIDPDGDTLSIQSVTQGAHGTVSINGGNVSYTPDTAYKGTDSFTYTVSDGKGGTAIGKVDDFFEAIDSDDFDRAKRLMRRAQIDSETIAVVLQKMHDADGEH